MNDAAVNAGCTPENLAHIVHAMHVSGELAKVSKEHLEAIVYALKNSGATDLVSTNDYNYVRPGLLSAHNCDFIQEPAFAAAYEAGRRTNSWGEINLEWRVHVLCWAATQALKLEGDFVECGVNRGGFSKSVMTYLDWNKLNKTFYLLDTFCGIPERFQSSAAKNNWPYEECFDDVQKTFSQYENVKLIRGTIPETLTQVESHKIAYLSVDLNCAEPEIDAANYFWERLTPGAVVVLDDYGAGALYQAQKVAWDDFATAHSTSILSLPTGQGIIVYQG